MSKQIKLKKALGFTDIHFGCKGNSTTHNEDCMKYIGWLCDKVKSDPEIDHIIFMGDWYESRSALNISTLKYSHAAASMLNDLGIPVFFIIGNHDLYYRNSREIYSPIHFEPFKNFQIINEPTVINNIHGNVLLCPFLFPDEYDDLLKHTDCDTWFGHFEFKGFIITGYGITMPTGPDHTKFNNPDFIFSGHFHQRQTHDNVVYVGNAFPTNFSDAGDGDRGLFTYDYIKKEPLFYDWEDCPMYIKTTLSDLLEPTETRKTKMTSNARVKCIVDIPITFEESTIIRQKFIDSYNLREFTLEESMGIASALSDTESDVDWEKMELANVNELVVMMLSEIESPHIDNDLLIKLYREVRFVAD